MSKTKLQMLYLNLLRRQLKPLKVF